MEIPSENKDEELKVEAAKIAAENDEDGIRELLTSNNESFQEPRENRKEVTS